jgi:hypothetical protein
MQNGIQVSISISIGIGVIGGCLVVHRVGEAKHTAMIER